MSAAPCTINYNNWPKDGSFFFTEKEMDRELWIDDAPDQQEGWTYLAPLLTSSSCPGDHENMEVVVVREGCSEQYRSLSIAPKNPSWTSFLSREAERTGMHFYRSGQTRANSSLGAVEYCRLMDIVFYKLVIEWPGAPPDPNHPETAGIVSYFVRLRLQKADICNWMPEPFMTVVDHHVDVGVGEWIVPRDVYQRTSNDFWSPGDCVKMFWVSDPASGDGFIYHGKVRRKITRDREDPLYDSPWATVVVEWLAGFGDLDHISPWELKSKEEE